MKKIYFIIIALTLMLCTKVMAEVVVTKRAVPNSGQTQQAVQKTPQPVVTTKLASSVKTCSPYSESLTSSVLGLNFNFNIQIKGWENNKCRIDFTAKSTGMNGLFKTLYGVDASEAQVMTYEPIAKCAFTKQQLASVGDSILQEQARKRGGKMLKDLDEIDVSALGNMSSNDEALMDMVFRQGACSISNGSSNPMDMNGLEMLGF